MTIIDKHIKLSELLDGLDVAIVGDENCIISGIGPIQNACPGQITFLSNALYRKYLKDTRATAVILSPADAKLCTTASVIAKNPYYIYAKVASHFLQAEPQAYDIDPTVKISGDASIHPKVSIGAYTTIGKLVKIEAGVRIGPHCFIGDGVEIKADTTLAAQVVVHHDVKIGARTQIASGVVIGSDGFGFAPAENTWHNVPQLGTVQIGNDVRVGANTTIDRGALEDTIIEDGVKLDNLIQVGHNVFIGAHTIIAGCVGIAGSAVIGRHCMIGGATCIAGHISICDHTMITGMTSVSASIHEPGIYSSGVIGAVPNKEFRKNNARFHRLGQLMEKVKQLENEVRELKAEK